MSSKRKLLKGSACLLTGMSTINSVQSFVVFGDYEKEKDTALNAFTFVGNLYKRSIDIADEVAYDTNYREGLDLLDPDYDEEEYNLAKGRVAKIKSDCNDLINTAYNVLNSDSSTEKKLLSQAVIKMFKDMFVGNYSELSEDSYFVTGKGSDFYNNFEALRLSNLVQLLKNILNSKDSLEYVQFVLDHKNLNGKKVAFVEGFGDDTEYDDSKSELMPENEKLLKVLGHILPKLKDKNPKYNNLHKAYKVILEHVLKHAMNELMDVGCLQKGLLHDRELMYKKGLWEEDDPYKSAIAEITKFVQRSQIARSEFKDMYKNEKDPKKLPDNDWTIINSSLEKNELYKQLFNYLDPDKISRTNSSHKSIIPTIQKIQTYQYHYNEV